MCEKEVYSQSRNKYTKPNIVDIRDRLIDINRTSKLPLILCHTYAADYDGDEMSIYPVKIPKIHTKIRKIYMGS